MSSYFSMVAYSQESQKKHHNEAQYDGKDRNCATATKHVDDHHEVATDDSSA
jgi:hypothetical protein